MTAINNNDFDLIVLSTIYHINSWFRSLIAEARQIIEILVSLFL